jgi:hypothetical protein
MKTLSQVSFVVMMLALLMFAACTAQQVKDSADTTKAVATAAQSMLPSPFGVIAGLVAGAAGLVSTLAASHVKGTALAAGNDPHPIADFVSSHSWIMPGITAAVAVANARGWISVSPTELTTLAASFGVATVGQVVADNHAEAQAPATPVAPK